MGKVQLNSTNGSITLAPEDGSGNVEIAIPRSGVISTTNFNSAMNLKANLDSPVLTGTPNLPTGTIGVTQTMGDSSTKIATTAFATGQDIGVGQTWQDVTASRASAITYTNSTGKPIMISVVLSSDYPIVLVNSVQIAGASTGVRNTSFIVPSGQTYKVTFTGAIVSWSELR